MKPMPLTFTKNIFHYEQILRDGQFAIYKQRLRPGAGCLAFEVIRIKQVPECEMFGKIVEAHESGPGNERWGQDGWTYPTLERAKAKFHALVAAAEQPAKPAKNKKTSTT